MQKIPVSMSNYGGDLWQWLKASGQVIIEQWAQFYTSYVHQLAMGSIRSTVGTRLKTERIAECMAFFSTLSSVSLIKVRKEVQLFWFSYKNKLSLGGAVAEWSKALLVRENIRKSKRSQLRPPTWAPIFNGLSVQPSHIGKQRPLVAKKVNF